MYELLFERAALKDMRQIPKAIAQRMMRKLELLAEDPYRANNNVKRLVGEEGAYRLRVGDYRAVYHLQDERLIVTVVRVKHRKEVYDG